MMTHNIFSECEDPDIADLENEMPVNELDPFLAEDVDFDLSLEMEEIDEMGRFQERMEIALLEDPMLGEGLEMDELEMEPILTEEVAPIQFEEEGPANFEGLVAMMKKYPGLKITFSF